MPIPTVTIDPPIVLGLNKQDKVRFDEDQFSGVHIITNNGGNHVDAAFQHDGPIMFVHAEDETPINEAVPIVANGTYPFRVKVVKTTLNTKNAATPFGDPHSWRAKILTTETIPRVTRIETTEHVEEVETDVTETTYVTTTVTEPVPPIVWYDMEVIPRYQDDPQRTFLSYAMPKPLDDEEVELHQQVEADVYLRKHELYNEPVLLNGKLDVQHVTDIWPEGGFDVNYSYESDEGKVHVTEIRTNKPSAENAHLKLKFENLFGWGLQVVYTVTPVDIDTYANANGGRIYTEIYLDSPGDPERPDIEPGGTADDPDNLKGYKLDDARRDKTDSVFSTWTREREEEASSDLR